MVHARKGMFVKRSKLTISHDDSVEIPPGETAYYMLLTDEDLEDFQIGRVSLSVRRRARAMLSWKQDQEAADEEQAEQAEQRRA